MTMMPYLILGSLLYPCIREWFRWDAAPWYIACCQRCLLATFTTPFWKYNLSDAGQYPGLPILVAICAGNQRDFAWMSVCVKVGHQTECRVCRGDQEAKVLLFHIELSCRAILMLKMASHIFIQSFGVLILLPISLSALRCFRRNRINDRPWGCLYMLRVFYIHSVSG